MEISIAEAHNHLSALLREVEHGPVLIHKRGKIAGVLISAEAYERLRKLEAYIQLLEVSRQVREGAGAGEIYRASRQELEERL